MMRKFGVSADNIIDALFVDAKADFMIQNLWVKDLFWAIRGGGMSFGVILAYKIKVVRVPEKVTVFKVEKALEESATDSVDQWQHVANKLPEELFIRLALDVVNSSSQSNGEKKLRASFISSYIGDSKSLLNIMNERFPKLGLSKSDCIETSWTQSILCWPEVPMETVINILLDRTPQTLVFLKKKSDYVKEPIPKPGLERIWKRMIELEVPRMFFNPYGGKMTEIPKTEIPFPHRAGNLWKIQYLTNWNESGIEAANHYIDLTRKLYDYMTPFVSKNPRQAYLNYRDLDLGASYNGKGLYSERRDYGIKYFKGNVDRLVKIKTEADPSNFLRNEQRTRILPYQHSRK